MRLNCIVLLAAVALLAKSDVVCANADATKLSKVASLDDASRLSVHAIGAINEKRRLRFHYDEEDDEEDDEERFKGANLFKESKLDEMMRGVKEFKRYKNLKAYGTPPSTLQDKLKTLYGKKYKDLWERYQANYLTI